MIIIRKLMKHLSNMSWIGVAAIFVAHTALTYVGLWAFDEVDLLSNFFYFYVVTASTVGYGDLSPSSVGGQYLTVLWIIPGGIALFTAVLGKVIANIQTKVNTMKNGMGNFRKLDQHVIVVGYKQGDTERLFRETTQKLGRTDKVVICTDNQCGHDNWIRAESYTDKAAYDRAGIQSASRVVIMLDDDGATTNAIMTVMSMIGKMKATANIPSVVAYIHDETQAELIRSNFPFVECVVSNKIGQLARAMADPGVSEVLEALVSSTQNHTMYGYAIPHDRDALSVDYFESLYDCSVVAVKKANEKHVKFVNNHTEEVYGGGDMVYYIAESRIK